MRSNARAAGSRAAAWSAATPAANPPDRPYATFRWGGFCQLDGGCARLLGFVFLRALHDDLVHPGEFIPGGGLHPIQRFLARRRVIPRRVIVRTRDVSSFMQEHPGGG